MIYRLLRLAYLEWVGYWSGDPRLVDSGWLGILLKDRPGVTFALLASLLGNCAWFFFSIGRRSVGWILLSICGLFTALWLFLIVGAAFLWFRSHRRLPSSEISAKLEAQIQKHKEMNRMP